MVKTKHCLILVRNFTLFNNAILVINIKLRQRYIDIAMLVVKIISHKDLFIYFIDSLCCCAIIYSVLYRPVIMVMLGILFWLWHNKFNMCYKRCNYNMIWHHWEPCYTYATSQSTFQSISVITGWLYIHI